MQCPKCMSKSHCCVGTPSTAANLAMIQPYTCQNKMCSIYKQAFFSCTLCSNNTFMFQWQSVNKHISNNPGKRESIHSQKMKEAKKTKLSPTDPVHHGIESQDKRVGNGTIQRKDKEQQPKVSLGDLDMIKRKQSKQFFYHDQHSGATGAKYIASTSIMKIEAVNNNIHNDDILFHLIYGELCMELSRPQIVKLARVVQLAVQITKENSIVQQTTPRYRVPIPDTHAKIRKDYTDGVYSISNLLPHPSVRQMKGTNDDNMDHGIVSFRDVVAELMAHNSFPKNASSSSNLQTQLSSENKVSFAHESKHYNEIVQRALLACPLPLQKDLVILTYTEWSDDFEKNAVKQNRGGVWIKTNTLSLATDDVKVFIDCTSPLALGRKESYHDDVDRATSLDLLSLREPGENNMFYHGGLQKTVPVYLELFVATQDQPERRSANYLLAGNSVYHARWGWACDHSAIACYLPACSDCLSKLISNVSTIISCTKCLNWSLEGTNLNLLRFPAPIDYPVDQLSHHGMLLPIKLSYDLLIRQVSLARDMLETGTWSRRTAESLLKFHCLNDDIVTRLLSAADFRGQLMAAANEPNNPIHIMKQHYPHLLEDAPFPPLWTRGNTLQCHIDVIMHLLFLGITKTTVLLIRDWVKAMSSFSMFQKYAKPILRSVPKVGWCVTAPYSGDKLGGWVSENYLAFARLSCWFYGPMEQVVAKTNNKSVDLPIGAHVSWKKDQLCSWLVSRGVTIESFLKPECGAPRDIIEKAEECIKDKKQMPSAKKDALLMFVRFLDVDVPENRRPPVMSFHKFDVVHNVIQSLHVMIAKIMAPVYTPESINMIERCIKIFLSRFALLSDNVYAKAAKPKWLTSYNFMCLLNLPATCRNIGPLRNVWEGSTKGEGFIRFVKPEIRTGLRENWEVNTLEKVMKRLSVRQLIKDVDSNLYEKKEDNMDVDDDVEDVDAVIPTNNYVVYKDLNTVTKLFENRQPISAVILGLPKVVDSGRGNGWFDRVHAATLTILLRDNVCVCVSQKMNTLGSIGTAPTVGSVPALNSIPNCIQVINGLSYCEWSLETIIKSTPDIPSQSVVSAAVILLPLLDQHGIPGADELPYYTVVDSLWRTMDRKCEYLVQPYYN